MRSKLGSSLFCISTEDAHTLYGLLKRRKMKASFFTFNFGINGVGPNTGLMFYASLSTEEIEHAILSGD